jgi:hypothetical protein
VLHDIERRTLLVKPAGKGARELAVGAANIDLRKRAGQLIGLPRRGLLTRAQPHDHFARTHRLPRLERQLARRAITLVEQAQHRHPLGHRSDAGDRRGRPSIDCDDLGSRPRRSLGLNLDRVHGIGIVVSRLAPARRKRDRRQQQRGSPAPAHQAPGVQAS